MEETPASLRQRTRAAALDFVPIAMFITISVAAGLFLPVAFPDLAGILFAGRVSSQLTAFFLLTLPVVLYFSILEASGWQASWGKRKLGLVVTDASGKRISWPRSLARTALKFLPWELAHTLVWQANLQPDTPPLVLAAGFGLVYLLAGAYFFSAFFSRERLALYDRISGARVVRRND